MMIGPALILLNQHILKGLLFPYPMFLSGLGVAASGLLANIVVRLGFVTLTKKEAIEGPLWYKRVLPVGLAHASTLAFGNTVYLFLNVGFIQMLKSFTPVIIIMTSYVANIGTPSMPVVYSVMVISLGTAAACSFSPEFSVVGLVIMFFAELAEGIRLIFTQFFLQQLKFGVIEGQYVLAPASAFWLFMASAFYELPTMIEKNAFKIILDNIGLFLVASFMGIGVNFLSYLVIQSTSSLTMKILGSVRSVGLIYIGILFYGEEVSLNEMIGYSIALLGFFLYNAASQGYWDSPKPAKVAPAKAHDVETAGSKETSD
jgi:multidrug transporter EmrE-like cation transporter